jgi:dTDP-4-amino-4,6-dideoxygalactose transaminase
VYARGGETVTPCEVSADLFARHLAIPMHAGLQESDVQRVAATLTSVVREALG